MSLRLYEIDKKLDEVMARAEEEAEKSGGEISKATAEMLDALDLQREEKIGNICRLLKSIKAEHAAIKSEADRLAARASAVENRRKWLTGYLQAFMTPGEKYKDAVSSLYWGNSTSVVVECLPAFLPKAYKKTSIEADKAAIKKALNDGASIEHCRIEKKQHIVVR